MADPVAKSSGAPIGPGSSGKGRIHRSVLKGRRTVPTRKSTQTRLPAITAQLLESTGAAAAVDVWKRVQALVLKSSRNNAERSAAGMRYSASGDVATSES